MSASHRMLTRLPAGIFESLSPDNPHNNAEELRASICKKLKGFPVKNRHGGSRSASVKTVGDLLQTPRRILMDALDPLLTYREIEVLLQRTCRQCAPEAVSALTLLHRTNHTFQDTSKNCNTVPGDRLRYLPTGLPTLDTGGESGIRVGTVTEVVGRAGAGKTQFALQLVMLAAKFSQGAIYVDTERKLVVDRLRDMLIHRRKTDVDLSTHDKLADADKENHPITDPVDSDTDDALRNMTIKQPFSTSELMQALNEVEDEVLRRNQGGTSFPVRLLVLDSIAAPMKRDFGSDAAPQRAAAAFSIAQTLKRFADQLHLAVVVINQVGLDSTSKHNKSGIRAALGTSWHHCVSTRILLEHNSENQHTADVHPVGLPSKSSMRQLSIVKSNFSALSTVSCELASVGIVETTSQDQRSADTRESDGDMLHTVQ